MNAFKKCSLFVAEAEGFVSPVGSVGASKGQWPFEVAAGDPHLSALLLRAI